MLTLYHIFISFVYFIYMLISIATRTILTRKLTESDDKWSGCGASRYGASCLAVVFYSRDCLSSSLRSQPCDTALNQAISRESLPGLVGLLPIAAASVLRTLRSTTAPGATPGDQLRRESLPSLVIVVAYAIDSVHSQLFKALSLKFQRPYNTVTRRVIHKY